MRAFAIAIILVCCLMFLGPVQAGNSNFMAFCVDGDGALSGWVTSRYEAYLVGTEHERTTRHRWEVWVQDAGATMHVPVCARLSDGAKPDTVKLENSCGRCVRFAVSRTNGDGSIKKRDIKLDANKSRFFRKLPKATIRVEGESDCSE